MHPAFEAPQTLRLARAQRRRQFNQVVVANGIVQGVQQLLSQRTGSRAEFPDLRRLASPQRLALNEVRG